MLAKILIKEIEHSNELHIEVLIVLDKACITIDFNPKKLF